MTTLKEGLETILRTYLSARTEPFTAAHPTVHALKEAKSRGLKVMGVVFCAHAGTDLGYAAAPITVQGGAVSLAADRSHEVRAMQFGRIRGHRTQV